MHPVVRRLERVTKSSVFVFFGGAFSIVSGLAMVYQWTSGGSSFVWAGIAYGAASTCVLVFTVYSFMVRFDNKALRDLSSVFCDINRIYRDNLRNLIVANSADVRRRQAVECEVLTNVAQRIENIFTRAINRQCLCTVKLLDSEHGRLYARTYVRSQGNHARDEGGQKFSVGDGTNTALDEAMRPRHAAQLPHFFSPDLNEEKHYYNQRQDYLRHYQSVLVVPIFGGPLTNGSAQVERDIVGFLCIDTLSRNRLNDTFHLQMLSALSAQMYSFMKTIRGREWIPRQEDSSHEG